MGKGNSIHYKYLLLSKKDNKYYKFYKSLKEVSKDIEDVNEMTLVGYFRHLKLYNLKNNNNNNQVKRNYNKFKLKDYILIKIPIPFKVIDYCDDDEDELLLIYNKRVMYNNYQKYKDYKELPNSFCIY